MTAPSTATGPQCPVATAMRQLAADSEQFPGKAIFAADIIRVMGEVRHQRVLRIADELGCHWTDLPNLDPAEPEPVDLGPDLFEAIRS